MARPRVGARMRAVVDFVARHPGCYKIDAANATGQRIAGYNAVDRAIQAGLIRCYRIGRGFALWPSRLEDMEP